LICGDEIISKSVYLCAKVELFIKNNNEYLYIDINQFQILLILCIIGSV